MLNLLNKFRNLLKREEVFSAESNEIIRLISQRTCEIKSLYNDFENTTIENKKTLYLDLRKKLYSTTMLVNKLPYIEDGNKKLDSMYINWMTELNTIQNNLLQYRVN